MTLTLDLRSFLALAQCGKVSTAAKQLHLSQPAVTARLRPLEEIVGKPLVSRSTRGVRLTTHGHALRTLSTEVQNTLSRIEASFHTEHKLSGELRCGARRTIASHVIPLFLAEFSRVYPDVQIELDALIRPRRIPSFQTACGALPRRVQTVYGLAEKSRVSLRFN